MEGFGKGLGRKDPVTGKCNSAAGHERSRMEDTLGQAFKRYRRKGMCPCRDCVANGKHFTIRVHKMLEVQSLYKPSLPHQHHQPRAKRPRLRLTSVPLVDLRLSTTANNQTGSDEDEGSIISNDTTSGATLLYKGGLCSVGDCNMESSRPGTASVRIKHLASSHDGEPRFPKLNECAHFHYEFVELGPIRVCLHEETLDNCLKAVANGSSECDGGGSAHSSSAGHLAVQVCSNGKAWCVRRSYENFRLLDRQLHQCIYDRKFSALPEIPKDASELCQGKPSKDALRTILSDYLGRFSDIAGNLINCGPVLNWLELDNRGNRLIVTDDSAINTPAVAAAYVVKRYTAKASDELSFEVGDMISVIDMPPPDESIWWRGKRGFEVGFFPSECVEVIGDKVPHLIHIPGAPTKPVLRKHGKLIAFFRSFILSRPSRRKLKQTGILKERVFGCDLGEHLLNSSHEIPTVLKHCADFIEAHGIVDGIYRLSGITSNIQKLRNAFDEDRVPDLNDEAILQDIHCVASLLKMYFRELPNPLLTYQLYDKFVAAVQSEEHLRLFKMRDAVQQLPPPHYRTLEYLIKHLARVAAHGAETGMTPKNVAIVWAPNLLRFKDLEVGGVAALQEVGVQAIVTEYLIHYAMLIFKEVLPEIPSTGSFTGIGSPKRSRPKSLAISTPTKLLSLEEARSRALGGVPGQSQQRYIEVGGGPANLPNKYHTVIDLPERHTLRKHSTGSGNVKNKKSPSGWKSFFSKGKSQSARESHPIKIQRKASTASADKRPGSRVSVGSMREKSNSETDSRGTTIVRLRSVKSAESLVSCGPGSSNRNSTIPDTPRGIPNITEVDIRVDGMKVLENATIVTSPTGSTAHSTTTPLRPPSSPPTHMRSVSHDSYFEAAIERERERQKVKKHHQELGSIMGDDTDEQDLSPVDDDSDNFSKGRTENLTGAAEDEEEEEGEVQANVSDFLSFGSELIGNMQKEVEDALAWEVGRHGPVQPVEIETECRSEKTVMVDVHVPYVAAVGLDTSFSLSSDEECRHIDSSPGIDEDNEGLCSDISNSHEEVCISGIEEFAKDVDEKDLCVIMQSVQSPRMEAEVLEQLPVVSVRPKGEEVQLLEFKEEEANNAVEEIPDEGILCFKVAHVEETSEGNGQPSSDVEVQDVNLAPKSMEDSDSSSSHATSGASPSPGELFKYALLTEEEPEDDGCCPCSVEHQDQLIGTTKVDMDTGMKYSPPSTLLLSLSLTPSPIPVSLSASPSISPRKLSPFPDRLLSPMDESKRKFESEIGRDIIRERRTKLELEKIQSEQGLTVIVTPSRETSGSPSSSISSSPSSSSSPCSSSSSSCIVVEVDASGFLGPNTEASREHVELRKPVLRDEISEIDGVKKGSLLEEGILDVEQTGRRSSEPLVSVRTEEDTEGKRRSEPVPRCLRPAERKASVRELVSKFEVRPKESGSDSPPSTPQAAAGKPPLFPKPRVIKLQSLSLSPPALHKPTENPLEEALATDSDDKDLLRKRTSSTARSRRRRRTRSYGEDRGAVDVYEEKGTPESGGGTGSEPCSPMCEVASSGQMSPLGALVLDQSESARRERIDRYKEERRAQLRQRIHSKQDDKEKRVSIF